MGPVQSSAMTLAVSVQRVWAPALLGAALALFVSWFTHTSLTDDAYISLAAARNLAEHGHWGVVESLTANTSTSPLNVIVLGLFTWLTALFGTAAPVVALAITNVLCGVVIGCSADSISRSLRISRWYGAAVTTLALLNPFVLSAVGLEVLFSGAGLLALTATALSGRHLAFGVVAGLLVLVRLDLIVCVVVVAVFTQAVRRHMPTTLVVFGVVSAPWYLFSWVVLGSAIPDTFLIKSGQAGDVGGYNYFTGPAMFFESQPVASLAAFGPAAVGVAIALIRPFIRTVREAIPVQLWALAAAGITYYAAYSLLNTVPYHWYYVVPTVALGCFSVFAAAALTTRTTPHDTERDTERRSRVTIVSALAAVFAVGVVAITVVSDSGHGAPWKQPVIFGNWASAEDYAQIGREVGAIVGDAPVRSPGEIGTLAYFCDCTIVDEFSDRGLIIADRLLPRLDQSGTLSRLILRANYANLDYGQRPVQPEYRLDWVAGDSGGRAWTWQVEPAGRGVGYFALTRYLALTSRFTTCHMNIRHMNMVA